MGLRLDDGERKVRFGQVWVKLQCRFSCGLRTCIGIGGRVKIIGEAYISLRRAGIRIGSLWIYLDLLRVVADSLREVIPATSSLKPEVPTLYKRDTGPWTDCSSCNPRRFGKMSAANWHAGRCKQRKCDDTGGDSRTGKPNRWRNRSDEVTRHWGS